VADRFEDITDQERLRQDPLCDRTVPPPPRFLMSEVPLAVGPSRTRSCGLPRDAQTLGQGAPWWIDENFVSTDTSSLSRLIPADAEFTFLTSKTRTNNLPPPPSQPSAVE